jgi:phosphoserine phosphatase
MRKRKGKNKFDLVRKLEDINLIQRSGMLTTFCSGGKQKEIVELEKNEMYFKKFIGVCFEIDSKLHGNIIQQTLYRVGQKKTLARLKQKITWSPSVKIRITGGCK